MEKYGVVTKKPDGEKTASGEDTCPECGAVLDKTSNVPKCPVHGTKPFEREDKNAEGSKEKG